MCENQHETLVERYQTLSLKITTINQIKKGKYEITRETKKGIT
jgi:hypothetical protein